MILSLVPRIRGLILDMDGVLWKNDLALIDVPTVFARIRKLDIRFIFATNNATLNVDQYQHKLARFGLSIEPWQIVNSGMAVAYLLSQRFPGGGPVYILGEDGVRTTLLEKGFHHTEKDVLAVVASFDRELTYAKLSRATLLIRSGVPFYATNPDRTFPTPEGLVPGSGAILAALEAATDTKAILAGKPAAAMMNIAMERLGTPPDQTLAVGDRLETDILGGVSAGCRTALVLSGVSSLKDLENWSPQPDLVAADLAHLIG
ncbi:MAG TPA: HAD-IIA family hydrolase [Anaerolineaceae bacterium]|nr:HAD-IIA family hydrolase [Anaerolineaceae bacterium]